MIVATDNYGTIIKIQDSKLDEYDEHTFNLNDSETPVLVFKAYTDQYQVTEVPHEVLPYQYSYTPEKGFVELKTHDDTTDEKEAIEQEYRDRLAQEVSGNVIA